MKISIHSIEQICGFVKLRIIRLFYAISFSWPNRSMKVLFIFFNYVQKILSKLYALDARFCMHQMQWIRLNNGLVVASQIFTQKL